MLDIHARMLFVASRVNTPLARSDRSTGAVRPNARHDERVRLVAPRQTQQAR